LLLLISVPVGLLSVIVGIITLGSDDQYPKTQGEKKGKVDADPLNNHKLLLLVEEL